VPPRPIPGIYPYRDASAHRNTHTDNALPAADAQLDGLGTRPRADAPAIANAPEDDRRSCPTTTAQQQRRSQPRGGPVRHPHVLPNSPLPSE